METSTSSSPNHEIPKMLFNWFDYTLFTGILGLSVVIGIYFGFWSKQNTTEEYLLGGKTMKYIPIAISLLASKVSGVILLAVPADIYSFGANYLWRCITDIFTYFVACYVFLPVFFKLQEISIYEYLNRRFNSKIRTLASFCAILTLFSYNPVVIYIPALAFSQVTGMNLHIISVSLSVICIFYTTIGGMRAVVWTDTLQFVGIIGSSLAIFFIGLSNAGGIVSVWEKALQGGRLDLFDFRVDPTIRDNFWSMIIGGSVHYGSLLYVHQGPVQKCMSLSTFSEIRKTVLVYTFGMILIALLSASTGIIMYAKYSECDPITSKQIQRAEQILPFFVMDVARHVPGLPGIFVAGLFSAALSTLSTTLNTLSGVIYKDFIAHFMPADTNEKTASAILKIIVIITGLICIGLVFVIEQLGSILQFITGVGSITIGPILGLFTLGILFPRANSKGALYGGLISFLLMSWIIIGNQWYISQGIIKNIKKPVSIQGCDFAFNITTPSYQQDYEEPFVLYRISFWYNTLLGAILAVSTGLTVSCCTKKDKLVHPDLICPIVQRFWFKGAKSADDYLAVDTALSLVALRSEK